MYNNILTIVSIADIHFGAIDSAYMYTQLQKQFLNEIKKIHVDIVAICGDLFDSKYMSNNVNITNAVLFMDELVKICREKNASIIIIEGTASHDSHQLSLFYHYLQDNTIDFRIAEKIQFESVKGIKILCIPELYGVSKEEYEEYLLHSGTYDLCLLHGTLKNSFKGSEIATLQSNHTPVFGINNFGNCSGLILAGHYHTPICLEEYMYYNGSAFRYEFGQEEEKGFLVTLYDKVNHTHCTNLVPIKSHTYITININDLINEDPTKIIEYIKTYKQTNNIDFIRVQFNNSNENMNIVRAYFRNISNVKIDQIDKSQTQKREISESIQKINQQYSYILDDNESSEYDKFVSYVNQNEGCDFITVDELVSLLEDTL